MKPHYILCWLLLLSGLAKAQLPVAESPLTKRTYPFVNYTEVGGLFGRVAYPTIVGSGAEVVENRLSLTLQTFNGVLLRPRLAVGGVVGVDWYASALLMPVGAGIRYYLATPNDDNVQIFASADVGYGITWLNKATSGNELTRGGLMLNPGIGLRFGKPSKAAFIMSVSYKRQNVEASKPLQWNDIRRDESRVYNRLAVRLGMSF
ncbi:hypothetical protein [Fibrella aquatica]|jgi:hypothetical protein|uniref:hypothetical protein n=1 Tax=Fibrella aquatica TaxID=3242487 RepID=UPI003520A6FE